MTTPATTPADGELLPCPFCGGPVYLERASDTYSEIHGTRKWWGVICRNTENRGGSCAIWQNPSASKEAAIERWNRRATPSPGKAPEPVAWIRPDELAKAKSAPYLCRVEPTKRMADFVPLYASPGKEEAERGVITPEIRKIVEVVGAFTEGMNRHHGSTVTDPEKYYPMYVYDEEGGDKFFTYTELRLALDAVRRERDHD